MKIRLYCSKDKKELVKLLEEFFNYNKKNYSEQTRKYINTIKSKEKDYVKFFVDKFTKMKRSRFLVMEDNGLIGYILGRIEINNYEKDRKRGHLESIFVTKNYRHKNIGKELYLKLVEWFKKQDCKQIILTVAEGNPTMKIYKKWGFETTRHEMKKKISQLKKTIIAKSKLTEKDALDLGKKINKSLHDK